MDEKTTDKEDKKREAFDLFYNKGLTNAKIGRIFGVSARTIRRWKRSQKAARGNEQQRPKVRRRRKRRYPAAIFDRAVDLKRQAPHRTAAGIGRILGNEFVPPIPCDSTIRNWLAVEGLSSAGGGPHREGYRAFQRDRPNELWQIDIAGVQTFGYLGKLYLFALLDDCSRFVPGARYFPDQRGQHVFHVLRDAFQEYGLPNQILADNGAQFRGVLSSVKSRYEQLLHSLGVEPIFAKPGHPQTKGKLERWFSTVVKMFALEARLVLKAKPGMTLPEFNEMFQEWVRWYNFEKPHRSLPGRCPPARVFLDNPARIYRPLQTTVEWDLWLYRLETRKVTKYNRISFQGKSFPIPPGHAGCRVKVRVLPGKIEVFRKGTLLIAHIFDATERATRKPPQTRRVSQVGTIGYKGKYYTVGYQLAGNVVTVRETRNGGILLVYLDGILVKEISLA